MHGVVDEKTDVFAFGVLLLELISGKKPVDGSHQSLHSWVRMNSPIKHWINYTTDFTKFTVINSIGKTYTKPWGVQRAN